MKGCHALTGPNDRLQPSPLSNQVYFGAHPGVCVCLDETADHSGLPLDAQMIVSAFMSDIRQSKVDMFDTVPLSGCRSTLFVSQCPNWKSLWFDTEIVLMRSSAKAQVFFSCNDINNDMKIVSRLFFPVTSAYGLVSHKNLNIDPNEGKLNPDHYYSN